MAFEKCSGLRRSLSSGLFPLMLAASAACDGDMASIDRDDASSGDGSMGEPESGTGSPDGGASRTGDAATRRADGSLEPDAGLAEDAGELEDGGAGPITDGDGASAGDSFGPIGRWPEHTPPYTSTADVVTASVGDLRDAIDAASSGTVIEHRGHLDSDELTGGSSGWTDNVLVRPPLGERSEWHVRGNFYLAATRVTLAGFGNDGNIRTRNCERCGWAWIENVGAEGAGYMTANGTDTIDPFIYEWVAPETGIGGDRFQFRGVGARLVRPTFVGLYLTGKTRNIGAGDHNDTMQTFQLQGGRTEDALIRDSVLFSAGDKAVQGDGGANVYFDHSLVYEPGTTGMWAPWPDGTDGAYGYHTITGGLSEGAVRNGSVIVGSFGSTVAVMRNSTMYNGSDRALDNVEMAINVTVEQGNPAPPRLPSEMTHAYLDSIWVE